jgi:hypothetical protein
MTLEENIVQVLQRAEQKIRAKMDAEHINASHRTERSLRVEKGASNIALVIGGERTAPLDTLEIGRPAGNVPGGFRTMLNGKQDVSNTFKAILVQWAKDKGIADFGWGRATVLGRRIAAEGTLRQKQPVDIYSSIVAETVDELNNLIGLHVAEKIDEVVRTNF